MVFRVLIGMLWATALFAAETDAVNRDRETYPASKAGDHYYLSVKHLPAQQWELYDRVLRFTCTSLSTQVVADRCMPVKVDETLYRIDVDQLRWRLLPKLIKRDYPYARGLPAIIRADYFILHAWTDWYYDLAFAKRPTKAADLYTAFGGFPDSVLARSFIESDSGVALRSRLIRTYPTNAKFDLWRTFDAEVINQANDPLEQLLVEPRAFSEWISPRPKLMGGEFFPLQSYALTNQDGAIADFAPANVVVNHRLTRGDGQIDNALDCLACHGSGLIQPTASGFDAFVLSGGQAYADEKTKERIELAYLSNLKSDIEHHNTRYQMGVRLITGVTAEQVAKEVLLVVSQYDADLTFDTVAVELGLTEPQLQRVLAESVQVPARIAQLPSVPIDRESFESLYLEIRDLCHAHR